MAVPNRVAAEVEPRPGAERRAAAALAAMGFRILDVGPTISVDAPRELWIRYFGLAPESPRATARPADPAHPAHPADPAGPAPRLPVELDEAQLPAELQPLIRAVSFVEPPDFHVRP
jgi:hypothetical protein